MRRQKPQKLAFIVAIYIVSGCTDVRHTLISLLSPDYEAEAIEQATQNKSNVDMPDFVWSVVLHGVTEVTDIQFPPGLPNAMYVARKQGQLEYVDLATGQRKLLFHFDVETASEQGLLGVALHPEFSENGRAFVNFSRKGTNGDESVVQELQFEFNQTATPTTAQPIRDIYHVAQPYQNHNAGQLAFGPDGYLYIGWGDGGWRGDPHGHGQNLETALGAMLRIDVDRQTKDSAYAVPSDNPFIGRNGALDEIWAYGLRNPWRYSFAPDGRFIVADVGQNLWEEVSIVGRGQNLGWNVREGMHCFEPKTGCVRDGLVDPIWEYGRDLGKSITGGYVYMGDQIPELKGRYIVGDFVGGRVWALTLPESGNSKASAVLLGKWPMLISTFGHNGQRLFAGDFGKGRIMELKRAD